MPFDPDNPTFYGESLPVEIARDVTGTAIASKFTGPDDQGQAVTYLYTDDNTQTMDAGDSAVFGIYPEFYYLERDSEAVFTAVVELAAGSSGTFRLSAGADPDWDLNEALCTEVLGTFTAAGQGRVLAPIAGSYTVPLIYDRDLEPLLFLEVLTGTVIIRQIRVRMWPPGGAAGAWTSDPSFETTGQPDFMRSSGTLAVSSETETEQALGTGGPQTYVPGPGLWGGFDDYGDTDAAFAEMTSALSAAPAPSYEAFEDSSSPFYNRTLTGQYGYTWTLRSLGSPGHDWAGGYNFGLLLIAFHPFRQTSRQSGPTWGDPDRIPWEEAAAVRDGVTKGTLFSHFGGWTVTPTISAGADNNAFIGVRIFGLEEPPDWDGHNSGFSAGGFFQHYYEAAGLARGAVAAADPAAGTVAIPDSPVVGIEVAPLFIQAPPGDTAGLTFESDLGVASHSNGQRDVNYGPTMARHLWDHVEWFNPALTPAPEAVPRFFVKDGPELVPVGVGKDPADPRQFEVPTPLGAYRDLTVAEYAGLTPGWEAL